MIYENVKNKNRNLNIKSIEDKEFKQYGEIVNKYDFSGAIKYMKLKSNIPEVGNIYVATDENLEELVPKKRIEEKFYGEMPCQVGFCNGLNSNLNGLEYHKGSELLVAVTDLVLLLGKIQDIDDKMYNTEKIEAFYVPEGKSIEIYATTLHFSPCKVVETGFKSIIILPRGTNTTLDNGLSCMLFAKNKWLIVHEEAEKLVEKGACIGLIGENTKLKL